MSEREAIIEPWGSPISKSENELCESFIFVLRVLAES